MVFRACRQECGLISFQPGRPAALASRRMNLVTSWRSEVAATVFVFGSTAFVLIGRWKPADAPLVLAPRW